VSAALSLILIVAAAYLAAHLAFEWLAERFHLVSGAEYLILGILLGPQISGSISTDVVASLAPAITLALGWTGAALGMNLYLPKLLRVPGHAYSVAILEAALTFCFVSGLTVVACAWAFDMTYQQVVLPALSLGAIATASATSGAAFVSQARSDPVVKQVETAALVDGAFAIIAFGILLAVVHIDVPIGDRNLTPTEWVAIALGIGVIGGILFHLFLGPERNPDRLFISMTGAIILASGAAAYLRLSPLLPSMLIGAILVNTSASREELQRLMQSVEKPLYYVLLVFAGASWRPSRYGWILPVALFVAARMAGKIGASRLSARLLGRRELTGTNWGLGLLGQGTLALAIGLSYSLNDMTLVPNVVFTAAIASVLVTDLFGVRAVVSLLDEPARMLLKSRRKRRATSE